MFARAFFVALLAAAATAARDMPAEPQQVQAAPQAAASTAADPAVYARAMAVSDADRAAAAPIISFLKKIPTPPGEAWRVGKREEGVRARAWRERQRGGRRARMPGLPPPRAPPSTTHSPCDARNCPPGVWSGPPPRPGRAVMERRKAAAGRAQRGGKGRGLALNRRRSPQPHHSLSLSLHSLSPSPGRRLEGPLPIQPLHRVHHLRARRRRVRVRVRDVFRAADGRVCGRAGDRDAVFLQGGRLAVGRLGRRGTDPGGRGEGGAAGGGAGAGGGQGGALKGMKR